MKIALYKDYGGFTFFEEIDELNSSEKTTGVKHKYANSNFIGDDFDKIIYYHRSNPALIETVENWIVACGNICSYAICEIPDKAFWTIDDNDGAETLYWSMSKINKI